MKKVKSLDELEILVGKESIEKCFMEYMLTVIGQAKRLEDLQNRCAVMDEDEMFSYINAIDRTELYDEKEDAKKFAHNGTKWDGYPRYLKAIRVSLVAMGYDEQWVDTTFRDALEEKYM